MYAPRADPFRSKRIYEWFLSHAQSIQGQTKNTAYIHLGRNKKNHYTQQNLGILCIKVNSTASTISVRSSTKRFLRIESLVRVVIIRAPINKGSLY